MATKKTLPTVELQTPGRAKPTRCPDSSCAIATRAAVEYWLSEDRLVRKSGDGPLETILEAKKGESFVRVATSPNGARFAIVTETSNGWTHAVIEPDGARREFAGASLVELCDDGRTFVAKSAKIQCVDRAGAPIGEPIDSKGYTPEQIREDGHAAIGGWSCVQVIAPNGELIKVSVGNGPTKAVAMHPSLPLIAAQFNEEAVLRVIDWSKGEVLFEHSAPWCRSAMSLSLSPDAKKVAVVGPGVHVFDLASKNTVISYDGGESAAGAFAHDGTFVLSRARARTVLNVDSPSEAAGSTLFSPALSRDKTRLAYTRDYKAYVADTRTSEERPALTAELEAQTRVSAVAIVGDDTLVIRASGYLLVVDIATQSVRQRIEAEDAAYIAVSPDGTRLALAGNSLEILDLATGARVELARDPDGFGALGWTPAGVSAQRIGPNSTGPIEVYSASPAANEKPAVCALAKSCSGYAECSFVHKGAGETSVVVIEASATLLIGPLTKAKATSKAVMKNLEAPIAYSSDGQRFAVVHESSATGGTVYEFDASATPVAIARFSGEDVHALALSHDGRTLVTMVSSFFTIGALP